MSEKPLVPLSSQAVPADAADVLRDCRLFFLKRLMGLVQRAGIGDQPALAALIEAAGAFYDEMVAAAGRAGFEQADGLTASRITLVGDDALELEIRLGELATHLAEVCGEHLWRVYQRYITLLQRPELARDDNPVGPDGIARGLMALATALALPQDKTLPLLDRVEKLLAEELPGLYSELNDLLAARQVQASVPQRVIVADAPRPAPPPAGEALPGNVLAALQQRLLAQAGAAPSGAGAASMAAGGTAGSSGTMLTKEMVERLLVRLDELDHLRARQLPAAGDRSGNSLQTLIPGLFGDVPEPGAAPQVLKARELGIPAGLPEAAAIDALAMIFAAIFDHPRVPEVVKTAIASLQIPLLKLSMLDPEFLAAEGHPARILIDRMARAAIGLPLDVARDHPLCGRLVELAGRVRAESGAGSEVFARGLAEVDALIDARDAEVHRLARAYLPLMQFLDQREQARMRARQVVRSFVEQGMPPVIGDFLEEHWTRVLRTIIVKHGEGGAEWQEATDVLADLLWSLQPKPVLDDRKQLATRVPEILRRLNGGFDRIGLAPAARKVFFDTCFALQTAALRGGPVPAATGVKAENKVEAVDFSLREAKSGELLLKIVDGPNDGHDLARSRALPCKVGDWLDFRLVGPDVLCGRLCWGSPVTGKLLLANPDWGFAVAMHPAALGRQLDKGQAAVRSSASLFHAAAAKALGLKAAP